VSRAIRLVPWPRRDSPRLRGGRGRSLAGRPPDPAVGRRRRTARGRRDRHLPHGSRGAAPRHHPGRRRL